jgi:hypothetical protein
LRERKSKEGGKRKRPDKEARERYAQHSVIPIILMRWYYTPYANEGGWQVSYDGRSYPNVLFAFMDISVNEFRQPDRCRAYGTPYSQGLGKPLSQQAPMARERSERRRGKEAVRRRGEGRIRAILGHPNHSNISGTTHHMQMKADGKFDTMSDIV